MIPVDTRSVALLTTPQERAFLKSRAKRLHALALEAEGRGEAFVMMEPWTPLGSGAKVRVYFEKTALGANLAVEVQPPPVCTEAPPVVAHRIACELCGGPVRPALDGYLTDGALKFQSAESAPVA